MIVNNTNSENFEYVSNPGEKVTWLDNSIDFLISRYIREYDLRAAGPTALLVGGAIDRKTYDWLLSLPRQQRQIQTGLLIRDHPEYEDIKRNVILGVRNQFIQVNGFNTPGTVLSLKNDAVFVVDKPATITKFGELEFVEKNIYTSYYHIGRTEIYYYINTVTNEDRIDVKNIGDDKLERHRKFFLDFLMLLFGSAELLSVSDVIEIIQAYEARYVRGMLPLDHYREFNPQSDFKIKNMTPFTTYYAQHLPADMPYTNLDISFNYNILRHFYKLFATLYFSGKK